MSISLTILDEKSQSSPRSSEPRKPVAHPKVFLMRPPQHFFFGVWPRGPRLSLPIGLLSIGSFLAARGIDVQVYDCFVESEDFIPREQQPAPVASRGGLVKRWMRQSEAGGITPFDLKPQQRSAKKWLNLKDWINWFSRLDVENENLVHFGASWEKLEKDLREAQPDIVAITNLFRENSEETLEAAALVRRVLPDAVIAVGGPNASAVPEQMLNDSSAIDMVGVGDGEHILLQTVEWLQGKRTLPQIEGIVYRDGGQIVRNPAGQWPNDLDTLGHLDYDLIKLERYFAYERFGIMARNRFSYEGGERAVSLITSRGCPYLCSFCSIHIHAGRKYRRYSVEHTLDHLETLVTKHGVRHVHFEDDNLTLDRPRFMKLMNGILERGLKFTWDTPNGVFASTLDVEMMELMKKTGCTYLILGVESGDQWVLDNVIRKQPLQLEHVQKAFALAKQVGIDMQAFYIIGFPREKLHHIENTLKFATDALVEYDVLPHLAIARPDPGTDLMAEAQAGGTLVSLHTSSGLGGKHLGTYIRHMVKTDEFTPEDLERLSIEFNRRFIRVLAGKTFRYLLRHPIIAARTLKSFVSSVFKDRGRIADNLVKIFFTRLFYRHSMLRESTYQQPSRPRNAATPAPGSREFSMSSGNG